jgi:predicted Zn finger-like uncharacterized protein
MILTCPECGTRYAVKDGAIPEGGRQVRCASCKHSWHQDPQADAPADAAGEAPLQRDPVDEFPAPAPLTHPAGEAGGKPPEASLSDHAHPDLSAEVTSDDPDSHPLPDPGAAGLMFSTGGEQIMEPAPTSDFIVSPEPEPILADPALSHETQPIDQGWSQQTDGDPSEDQFSAYASAEEPEEPRRRGLIGLLLALFAIAALVVGFWFLAPAEWKQRLGIAQSATSAVMVQLDETNRRTLASGNELLEVTGKVINPTDQPQRVPQIEAMLRTYQQKVVYRWTIPPPAPVLAPGGSATFNSAELLSIPADAACLSVLASNTDRTQLEPCTPASQQVAQPS